jgi:hypothetical protein
MSIIEEPSVDAPHPTRTSSHAPHPDTISSDFVPTAYSLDDDDDDPPSLLDSGESVTSHESSVDSAPPTAKADNLANRHRHDSRQRTLCQ